MCTCPYCPNTSCLPVGQFPKDALSDGVGLINKAEKGCVAKENYNFVYPINVFQRHKDIFIGQRLTKLE